MNIQKFVVGQLQTNCYLISDDISDQCLIIDPGDEANLISENILRQNLKPQAIIATHGHFDHILAAGELQMAFNIPFCIHQADEKIVNYMTDSAQHWLNREIIEQPPTKIKYLEDNDVLKIENCKLKIISTPGHSPGGTCLFNNQEKVIFTGDTLFKDGIGRTDFSYASPQKMKQSLEKIRNNFSGYTAYPGHGEEFII
jgi:hydroxyacylglutathione hydrolase